jgi:hypothetical protein
VFKMICPSALTGKLSDVAGLIVCPLLVLRTIEMLSPRCFQSWSVRRNTLYAALVLVALVLVGIKTVDAAAFTYQWGLAAAQWPVRSMFALMNGAAPSSLRPVALVRDHSDLWTLPSLLVPWWIALGSANITESRG